MSALVLGRTALLAAVSGCERYLCLYCAYTIKQMRQMPGDVKRELTRRLLLLLLQLLLMLIKRGLFAVERAGCVLVVVAAELAIDVLKDLGWKRVLLLLITVRRRNGAGVAVVLRRLSAGSIGRRSCC